jgi:hypothetical protein
MKHKLKYLNDTVSQGDRNNKQFYLIELIHAVCATYQKRT